MNCDRFFVSNWILTFSIITWINQLCIESVLLWHFWRWRWADTSVRRHSETYQFRTRHWPSTEPSSYRPTGSYSSLIVHANPDNCSACVLCQAMKCIVVMKSSARNTLCVIENYGIVDAILRLSRFADNENVLKHNKSQSSLNRFCFVQINLRVWMAFRFGNLPFFSLLCFLHNVNALLRRMSLRFSSLSWNFSWKLSRKSSRNFIVKFMTRWLVKFGISCIKKLNPQRKRNVFIIRTVRSDCLFMSAPRAVCFMIV